MAARAGRAVRKQSGKRWRGWRGVWPLSWIASHPHEWRRQLCTARRRASDANSQKESRFVTEREG